MPPDGSITIFTASFVFSAWDHCFVRVHLLFRDYTHRPLISFFSDYTIWIVLFPFLIRTIPARQDGLLFFCSFATTHKDCAGWCREGAVPDLSLSVAVGFGPSHVATLAAAGHRFFVVGGAEVQLATDRSICIVCGDLGQSNAVAVVFVSERNDWCGDGGGVRMAVVATALVVVITRGTFGSVGEEGMVVPALAVMVVVLKLVVTGGDGVGDGCRTPWRWR